MKNMTEYVLVAVLVAGALSYLILRALRKTGGGGCGGGCACKKSLFARK